jgi:replicative DNA helicase
MPKEKLIKRLLSFTSKVRGKALRSGRIDSDEWPRLYQAYEELYEAPLFINDKISHIDDIPGQVRRWVAQEGVKCVFIDYLQLLALKKFPTENQALADASRTLTLLAKETDIPVIGLSQLNRPKDEQEAKKAPELHRLRGSGAIEQDADVVEFLWHDPNDMENGGKVIQQTIAKGRDTGLNEFRLLFKGWIQRFEELPRK